VQDNVLRPSIDSSAFTLTSVSESAREAPLEIWCAMMGINILATVVMLAWGRRRR
jgi:hypothetical protein